MDTREKKKHVDRESGKSRKKFGKVGEFVSKIWQTLYVTFLLTIFRKKAREKQSQENGKEDNGQTDESGFDGWSSDPIENGPADDEWSEDTSAEAVKNRQLTLGEGIKGLVVNDDLEKTEKERFDIFFKFVKVSMEALYVWKIPSTFCILEPP